MNLTDLTTEFILSEVKKLQYFYGLKGVIRYGQSRPENDLTESVAEHIYGMGLLANYFLPLEDKDDKMDKTLIYEMILLHDIDEIETGDTIGYLKTPEISANEQAAAQTVITGSPLHMQKYMLKTITNYSEQTTPEARFVKALDRFEPLIQVYSDFGRNLLRKLETTANDSARIKEPYLKAFPFMYAYYEVIQKRMIVEDFFTHG